MTTSSRQIPVALEIGKKRIFASALDWPGWTRSGRDEAAALAALLTPRGHGFMPPLRAVRDAYESFTGNRYTNLWLKGLGVTLAYSLGTVVGGMIIGVICGLLLLYRRKWVTLPIHFYVELFRCTPLLVQIVWFYYALPIVLQVELPAWLAAGLGLTLYMGAFATEIFRGGIISIDKGQSEAGAALGMTPGQSMRRIVLPQAIKRMIPALMNQSIIQFKNTSLVSVLAVPDLVYQSQVAAHDSYRPLETYTAVAVAYAAILIPLTIIVRRGEKWRCEAWGSDGFAESTHASAELTIRNTAPTAPAAACC